MKKQLKAIVLGGTDDHIALIKNLQNRGYYVILIDYHANPPAKKVADIHIQKSTLDQENVLAIARDFGVDLIISACIDQALLTACYVAEKLDLPAPFSYEIALNVTNKGYMKKKMIENGMPTSKFYFVDTKFNFTKLELVFPVMVKPADSNGSFGVRKASNLSELNGYLESALNISRTSKAIVEEFKDGIEVGIDCFIQDNQAKILMMGQVLKKPINESVLLIYQTVIPAEITEGAKRNIQEIANKIAECFNLNNTPLLLQTLVKGDVVNVIEFSPRVGGASKHRTVKLVTGFDILNSTVDSFLGIRPVVNPMKPKYYYSRNHIYAEPAVFGSIENYTTLIDNNVIEELVFFKTQGMEIGLSLASRDRVGSFLVKAKSKEELFRKIKMAVDQLEVFDINGNRIMKKDIFEGIKV